MLRRARPVSPATATSDGGPVGRVVFDDVSQRFASRGRVVHALDHISLELEAGSFVCLVGPSGCGKTTLLRLLAGFMQPTSGRVLVDDRPIDGPSAQRGVVFQHPTLYPWLDVRRNVELGPRLRRVPAEQRRAIAREHLDLVGLHDFADAHTYELSGGMQQRAQIARALANDPPILLMDEPFGALDALTRENLQVELRRIWRATGKTVLFITHSVEEALFLGTRVIAMTPRPGRVALDLTITLPTTGDPTSPEGTTVVRTSPEFGALRDRVTRAISTGA